MLNDTIKQLRKVQAWEVLTRDEVRNYNRELLRATDYHQYQVSNTITYTFHFEGADEEVTIDDFLTVERSYLMGRGEIEKIWDCVAEQNSRYFVRKDVEIRYPSCLIGHDLGEF